MIDALDIRVRGIVQGVGFRPFVYRLARRYLVNGWVFNDLEGVFIHAEAESKLLDEFVTELHMNPPAAAVVKEVELKETVDYGETDLRSIIEGDRKYNQNESFASQGYSQQEFQGEELVEVDEQDNGEEPLDIDFDENEDLSED
jgi:acylphosphatase